MTNVLDIIISGDYELFGNGSGDILNCIIRPTNDILNICEKNNAKFTIFVDIVEYWAFKKYAKELENDFGYIPHKKIEEQLKDAVKRGHDVQLHLHPQFLDAEYKNREWILNYDWWRLPSLPNGLGSKDDVKSLIGIFYKGKKTLEEILREVNPNYSCIGFRAGGYCIQPEKDVIKAMRKVGLYVDSTVYKYGYKKKNPYYFDFRNAYSNIGPWETTSDNLNKKNNSKKQGIIEFPILSCNLSTTRKIFEYANRKINKKKLKNYGCKGSTYAKSLQNKKTSIENINSIFDFLHDKTFQWDFCLYSKNTLKKIFRKIWNKNIFENDSFRAVVMTGHPKDFKNIYAFNHLLKWMSSFKDTNYKINFTTLTDSYNHYKKTLEEK